ncbi:hypothetical protein KC338_g307 [Hortaea werneckii]|nr:hypothetical protein KC338_g307 [Hortaea werneckii]
MARGFEMQSRSVIGERFERLKRIPTPRHIDPKQQRLLRLSLIRIHPNQRHDLDLIQPILSHPSRDFASIIVLANPGPHGPLAIHRGLRQRDAERSEFYDEFPVGLARHRVHAVMGFVDKPLDVLSSMVQSAQAFGELAVVDRALVQLVLVGGSRESGALEGDGEGDGGGLFLRFPPDIRSDEAVRELELFDVDKVGVARHCGKEGAGRGLKHFFSSAAGPYLQSNCQNFPTSPLGREFSNVNRRKFNTDSCVDFS